MGRRVLEQHQLNYKTSIRAIVLDSIRAIIISELQLKVKKNSQLWNIIEFKHSELFCARSLSYNS